ncbi:MAG: KamA family radical SAM protein [Deltaproteobacteria bacterium]|nr:KamA family radical SAM protein [Deltaproteobacteria bacterium]
MESEALFNEEVEPPGRITGLVVGIDYNHRIDDIFPSRNTHPNPPVVLIKPLRRVSRFKDSTRAQAFRKHFYPEITTAEWQDWKWQFRNRITDVRTLSQMIWLSQEERLAMNGQEGHLPVAITPYYVSLLDEMDVSQPLRRMVVPVTDECCRTAEEEEDPLGEENDSPVAGIVHRYPDRVLFLVTDSCATYCRYCTRSRIVGRHQKSLSNIDHWESAIAYIKQNPQIRDVLLSGGDPLTLSDSKLEWLLSRLKEIPHLEILRIGTKVPVVMPQRITTQLIYTLKRFHPLWISIHVNHPDEITPEMSQACTRLANAGIPLGSQTVLLHKINDNMDTMKRLVHGLLKIRVKPYYLYQCDPIPGSSHFRTSVNTGLDLIGGLRGHTTGYAVPTYVIDAPGGGGKIPLLPEYVIGHEGNHLILRNYQGRIFHYPDSRCTP